MDVPVVRCQGAPRDLGLDQGRGAQESVRAEARRVRAEAWLPRLLFETWPGGRTERVRRDVMRHFPHMAERTLGLARGARVGTATLAALLARSLDRDDGASIAVAASRTGAGALVARSIRLASEGGPPSLWVRHSAPETDYRSVEVVLPWRVPALIGVNEHGLAACATGVAADPKSFARCAAPGVLLVQDCLQRFDAVDKALEWIERRPAGGRFSVLLADASGRVAGVSVEGPRRRLLDDAQGCVVGVAAPAACATLEKVCRATGELDSGVVAHALGAATPGAAMRVVADARARRIAVLVPGVEPAWHAVEPPPA